MFDTSKYSEVKDRPRKGSHVVYRYYNEYGELEGRTCTRCGEVKSVEIFPKATKTADGYQSQCKPCTAASRKALRDLEKLKKMERAFGPRPDRRIK